MPAWWRRLRREVKFPAFFARRHTERLFATGYLYDMASSYIARLDFLG
jgi:hypothetical protein